MAGISRLSLAIIGALAASETAAAEPACEFHVWVSPGLSVVAQTQQEAMGGGSPILPSGTMSSISGDYVGQNSIATMVKGDPGEEDSPLTPKRQIELLSGLQIAETFALTDYQVTFHDDAVDSLTLRRARSRLTESTAPCYAELVLQDVTYSLEFGRDDKLRTLFYYRKFGQGNAIERRFSTFAQQKLEMTPRKKDFDKSTWEAEVQAAFGQNVIEFAESLNK